MADPTPTPAPEETSKDATAPVGSPLTTAPDAKEAAPQEAPKETTAPVDSPSTATESNEAAPQEEAKETASPADAPLAPRGKKFRTGGGGTNGAIGKGAQLLYGVSTPSTPLAGLRDMNKDGSKVDDNEITSQDDAAGGAVRMIPGWIDEGTWTADLVYNKTQRAAIESIKGVTQAFKILRPDGTSSNTFNGYINGIGSAIPFKGVMTGRITIRVDGVDTFTAGT